MGDYIYCLRKKNNPRMDVRICQEKCPLNDQCLEFVAYQKRASNQSLVSNPRPIIPPLLSPMASKN
jgi:hypothetical protein